MENKFRCHPSIILEKVAGVLSFFIIVFISNIDDVVDILETGKFQGNKILLIGAAILIVDAIYNFLVWRKTYISIEDGTIVLERNTINKKINTFGIKNIANINIEQNIFERIISTCKVKIDTDSRSTADETDIEIVLKKDIATEFKKVIMQSINQSKENGQENLEYIYDEVEDYDEYIDYDINYSNGDILKHCFYNIDIMELLINIAVFIGVFVYGINQEDHTLKSFIIQSIIIIANFCSIFKNLLGDYIKYYNFKSLRKDDKIYFSYGLFTKVEYSIPVDRINAININQTILSRIFNKYKVDISVVGLGDDEDEVSQIILFESKKMMVERFNLLLPEFNLKIDFNFEKQSKKILFISFVKSLIIMSVLNLIVFVIYELNLFTNMQVIMIANLILSVFLLVFYIMKYKTAGIFLDDDFVSIVSGRFSKSINIIKYKKIQYIEILQGPISKTLGLQHGTIHILAGLFDNDRDIDYYNESIFDRLIEKI